MSKFTANTSVWIDFIDAIGDWSRSGGSSWSLNIRIIKCSKVDNHVDPCWWCRHNCSRQSYYRHIPGYSGRYSFRSEPCMLKLIFSRNKPKSHVLVELSSHNFERWQRQSGKGRELSWIAWCRFKKVRQEICRLHFSRTFYSWLWVDLIK